MEKSTSVITLSADKIKDVATTKTLPHLHADTIGKGVEQPVYGRHVLRNGALLDAAHKLLAVQGLSGELELLDVVVRWRRGLLVLHLHLTDPTSLVSHLSPAICIRLKSGAPRLTFRRSLLSSGRLSASCLSS